MKKKSFLALALAMAIATGVAGTSSIIAWAAPYTQAQTPDQVTYGRLSEEELEIVYKYFDAKYYYTKYEDLREAFGYDEALLLEHFVKCGIFEGREGWPTFNASAYASAYPDLKDAFGRDIVKYFVHYYTIGIKEGRTITTIEACEKAGIKVISLFDEDDFVSTEIYAGSNLIGTNDYNTVEEAANSAARNGASVVQTPESTTVIATPEVAKKLAKDNDNYEVKGAFSIGTDREVVVLVYKNSEGEYKTKLYNDIVDVISDEGFNCRNVVGFIPTVAHTVDEANTLIKTVNEEAGDAKIEEFNVAGGNVVGTEGVVITLEDKAEFLAPDEDGFEAPHKRNMENYYGGQYINNAYVGVDENGSVDTEYEIGTLTEEDGENVKVTTGISNEETGYYYEVTYTFDGDPYKALDATN